MIKILTWLWKQEKAWCHYDHTHVNAWAKMVSSNLTIPHTLACVTNMPEGIDPSIEIIPLPDFPTFFNPRWLEKEGKPQCYRRLDMFRNNAPYGERFVSMDLDCIVFRNIDHLFTRPEQFVICSSMTIGRPYNGSMLMLTNGSRSQVYDRLNQEDIITASKSYLGSDQSWIAYVLGCYEKTWNKKDGIYFYRQLTYKPTDVSIMFFAGDIKPWESEYAELWRQYAI